MLKSLLQKIGFSTKDAAVYLACLELGTQPASVIAKKAGLKRPTTYLILENLLRQGLVSEYTGSNVKYFTAVAPEYLLTYLDKRRKDIGSHQRELEQLLPQFASLSNPYSLTPKVRFFEGVEGVRHVMDDTLTSKEELRCFSSIDGWFAREDTKQYLINYGKRRVHEYKLPIRSITLDTPLGRQYMEVDYPPDPEGINFSIFRWLPKDVGAFMNEVNIYDNKVAICALGKYELMGVIIESKEVAETQKTIFELAWKGAIKGIWEKGK